ncbi:nagb/rpia/CoA transferase-like protein [Morchella conica CCBAS932]|uniref:Translation initiation factor eIF2B subunit beta n=1 Tax=Morchella conica CCBAS932 TaxID=1392247 RepID=A0A3N4KZY1_9PEZI|nr:nagb/rpia/CoA transferase-like protein [Morchella conica CCBAS932]
MAPTAPTSTLQTPGLKWWLTHLETDFHHENSVELYVGALKRRVIRNPVPAAVGTAQLFLRLISSYRFQSIRQLVDYISGVEERLSAARPREMSVRNMVRRVVGIIREEAENNGMGDQFQEALRSEDFEEALQGGPTALKKRPSLMTVKSFAVAASNPSLTNVFEIFSHPSSSITSSATSSPPSTGVAKPQSSVQHDVRPAIIQDIQELIEELDSCETNLAEYAMNVIHRNEVILTYGFPSTVQRLLLRAAQKRDFTVVVVEGSLNVYRKTHNAVMNKDTANEEDEDAAELAARKSLQDRGIQVIVISDSDVINFMGRVNKVILGTEYVFADGSLLAPAGTKNIVRAAKARNTPVVVLSGSYALCPITTFFEDQWIEMGAPKTVDFQEGYVIDNVEMPNPMVDFIPGSYVGYFVTNNGIVAPNAMYRATLDLYHMSECDLL